MTTSTSVMAMAAIPISRRPLSAAVQGVSPSSRCLTMFSSTTMLSSTSTPITSTSASVLMMLSVKPRNYIARKVLISEVGMANRTMSGAAQRVQEEQQHQPGQDDRLQQRRVDAVERGAREVELVGDDRPA